MRLLLCGTFAALIHSVSAAAEPRLHADDVTCGELKDLLAERGALIVTASNPGTHRVVADRGYCTPWEVTQPIEFPTADIGACRIVGVCSMPDITGALAD